MKTSREFRAALIVVVAILQVSGLPLAMAAPRPPLPPLPDLSQALCKERFDEPYRAGFTNAQVSFSDYTFVESWSGYALQRSGGSLTPFVLPALSVAGRTNVACDSGALSFWFRPYWSSPTNYIGAYYTWRLPSGATLDQPRLFQPGMVDYSPEQFGDYSATMVDPVDDWSFWTVQEYATSLGLFYPRKWATVIANIRPGP